MISKYRLFQWALWLCIFILSSILSCSKSSESASNFEGQLFIKLLDAPANYQQLNIVFDRVSIHRTGASADVGWTIASTNSVGPINLLSLRNGASEPLVLNIVPVGKYNQIKLHFGPCTVKEYGSPLRLITDTTQRFEHTVNYDFEVFEGQQAQLTFDFNVSLSVSKNGNDYRLTPVIRVQNTLLSGWIVGSIIDTISRKSVPSSIDTWTGLESVSTLNDTLYGSFQLSALPENYYSLRIVPLDTILYQPVRIDSISVRRQLETNIGIVFMKQR